MCYSSSRAGTCTGPPALRLQPHLGNPVALLVAPLALLAACLPAHAATYNVGPDKLYRTLQVNCATPTRCTQAIPSCCSVTTPP